MKIFLILVLIYLGYVAFRTIRNFNRQIDEVRGRADQFRQHFEERANAEYNRNGASSQSPFGAGAARPGEKDITSRSRIVEENTGDES